MTCDSPLHSLPQELRTGHDRITSILNAAKHRTPSDAIEQLCFLIFLKILDEEAEDNVTGDLFPSQTERFRWSRWCGKPAAELRDFLSDDVFPYMSSLVREDQQVADYFRGAALEIKEPEMLKRIVDELDQIKFTKLQSIDSGNFFEAFLGRLSNSSDTGHYYIPKIIREIMITLANPKAGETINDMACGTGGLLVEAIKIKPPLIKHLNYGHEGDLGGFAFNPINQIPPGPPLQSGEFYVSGADISHQMVRITTMNLILHGIRHPKITRANTLATTGGLPEDELNRKYSIVLCDPPMGMQVPRGFLRQGLPNDARRSELLFTWLAMELLEPGGRAAVILPEAVLSATAPAAFGLRKKLVDDFDLLAVISLPSNCFRASGVLKASIVVFRRPTASVLDKNCMTLFCELDNYGSKVLDFMHHYVANDLQVGVLAESDVSFRHATRKAIAAAKYNLAPENYILSTTAVEDTAELIHELLKMEQELITVLRTVQHAQNVDTRWIKKQSEATRELLELLKGD
ncbi:MAG TPA: SAM-dependent DNA methyltransferase [Desulfuromonadales bacterium]|nr:SAM-dependent DNA methyltransferase [Desulfuromonadales bacterium]